MPYFYSLHTIHRTVTTLAGLAVMLWAQAFCFAQNAVPPAAGDGSAGNPYQLSSVGNLVWLHDQTDAGATSGKYYKLVSDIDASETAGWNDTATSTDVLEGFPQIGPYVLPDLRGFAGVFDGDNHTVSGLTINRQSEGNVGLFGCLVTGGSVMNLGLENVSIKASNNVGALVGYNMAGSVTNCHATGTVYASLQYGGGLVGQSRSSITYSYTDVTVTGGSFLGGLVGRNNNGGGIAHCHATGSVTGSSYSVGGLAGYVYTNTFLNDSYATGDVSGADAVGGLTGSVATGSSSFTFSNCYATGDVSGNDQVGGLVGAIGTDVTAQDCYATGEVHGQNEVGGLVGYFEGGTINNCYAAGNTTGSEDVGGLAGVIYYIPSAVEQSYALGDVEGTLNVGGFAGHNHGGDLTDCYAQGSANGVNKVGGFIGYGYSGNAIRCYSTGAVTGTLSVGGFLGYKQDQISILCFWDTQTSGQATSLGGTGVAGKTTAQMMTATTFSGVGWNFTSTWGLQGTYPYLQAPPYYTLSYEAGTGGSIGGSILQVVNAFVDGPTVTATPDPTYWFVKWDDQVTSNPRTDETVTTDVTATALFDNTYTVTYLAGEHGSIDGPSPQQVAVGSDSTAVTAVPEPGYHFTAWSDEATTNPRIDETITTSLTVTANFEINQYTLNYTAGEHGSIDGTTPQTVNHGANGAAVTAVPATGYHFVDWSDGSSTNPRTETNVTTNVTVTASFAPDQYTLTYNAGLHGSIDGTTPQTVNHGASGAAVTAVPSTGYHFVDWSDGSSTNPRTEENITTNVTVTASFAINQYTLTYTAGEHGSIDGTTPQTVNHGANGAAVTAVPSTGYHFVKWSDDSTANPRTEENVTTSVTVTASFAINQYTLTYNAGLHGSIDGTTPQTVNHGANGAAVTAIPATGYHFVDWSDGSSTNPRTEENVTTNVTVTASFAINQYTLTYTAGEHGSIDGTTPQTVDHGASGAAVTAVPATGYHFVSWSDDSTANPRTDASVTANLSVSASFAANTEPSVSCGEAQTSDTTPTWNWSSGGGTGLFRIQLGGPDEAGWSSTSQTTWTPSQPLAPGTYVFYVQEQDATGQWSGSGSATVTIRAQTAAQHWQTYR